MTTKQKTTAAAIATLIATALAYLITATAIIAALVLVAGVVVSWVAYRYAGMGKTE